MKARVKDILKSAEADIRVLLSEMALTADVDEINWLAGIARQLHNLATPESGSNRTCSTGEPGASVNQPPQPRSETSAQPASPPPRRIRAKKDQYPQFQWEDNGNTLVKIGWSKKKRQEYRDRAPKRVLELLKRKLDKLGKNGNVFTMEDVLPLNDPDTGKEISSYQVYLCVAYLSNQGRIARNRNELRLKQYS